MEDKPPVFKHILPRLDSLTLVWQAFSPNVHHAPKVIVVLSFLLQEHIADSLLTFEDLLEQNKVLVLHSIDVAWQVLSDLLDSELLVLLVVFV